MSLKRILFIAGTIGAGIVLGIGGYLFFTAGGKPAPVPTQAAKAVPESVPLTAPVPEKPSEAPVADVNEPRKPEPVKPEAVQSQAKPSESGTKSSDEIPKKDAAAKSGDRKTGSEPPLSVKSESQQSARVKQAKKKGVAEFRKGGKYFVQAGLFENEKNAETVTGQLKKHGYIASISKIEGKDGKTLYRVIAGAYPSFKRAVEVSDSLNKAGIKTIVHKR